MVAHTISVVVPAYNAGPWIAETLRSVLGQSREPDEVVVVENGSTDGTLAELDRFAGRVRVVRMERRGAPAAYNRGFLEARGDYVAMCPADDIWRPRKLEWQVESIEQNPAIDIAFGHARHFGLDNSEYKRPPGVGVQDVEELRKAMYVECLIPAPTALIRHSLYEQLGPFREDLPAEDYEFWMRALRARATFFYDPRCLVDYRRHGNNISSALIRMRRDLDYPVHIEYSGDVEPQLAAEVLAGDLRHIGRYYFDAGRRRDAYEAYRGSLAHKLTARGLVATAALSVPGGGRALRLLEAAVRRPAQPR